MPPTSRTMEAVTGGRERERDARIGGVEEEMG
jgi:hypothetical protein